MSYQSGHYGASETNGVTTMVKNYYTGEMQIKASEMTWMQMAEYRKFPAHITSCQMREEIEWHQNPAFKLYTGRI